MQAETLKILINKYLDGTATTEERAIVLKWYRSVNLEQVEIKDLTKAEVDAEGEKIWNKILTYTRAKPKRKNKWLWVASTAAAVLILLFLWKGLVSVNNGNQSLISKTAAEIKDVAPGRYAAKLQLSNGKTILLDSSTSNGLVAAQGTVRIVKNGDELRYVGNSKALIYNTISTAKGMTWQLTLPDGTKAWLNASSSIRYPIAFTGKERVVEMTGEVYFDVKHDEQQPFIVKAGNQVIKDIGTAFNVAAYADEKAIVTTLVEGAARVSLGTESTILHPGQQTLVSNAIILNKNADVQTAIAWKEGSFQFNEASLKEVMKQISRWYNVTVEYQVNLKPELFTGKIPRNLSASKVLKILQQAGIHFTIVEPINKQNNGKIIVSSS